MGAFTEQIKTGQATVSGLLLVHWEVALRAACMKTPRLPGQNRDTRRYSEDFEMRTVLKCSALFRESRISVCCMVKMCRVF